MIDDFKYWMRWLEQVYRKVLLQPRRRMSQRSGRRIMPPGPGVLGGYPGGLLMLDLSAVRDRLAAALLPVPVARRGSWRA